MTENTPFLNPNRNIDHQLLVSLILICTLDKTARNKKEILSYERFVIYDYLINNPSTLNKILLKLGKKQSLVLDYEKTRLSLQTATKIFKNDKLKVILQILITNNLASTTYSGELGLLYTSTPEAKEMIREIESTYLNRVKKRATSMQALQSSKVFKLKILLSEVLGEQTW